MAGSGTGGSLRPPAMLRACATDGCPSRSSRPSSSATTRSPTTSPRAPSPTAGSATWASSSTSTSCSSATATTSAIPCSARPWPRAATASAPTTSWSPPAPPPPSSAPPRPCSSPATTRSSCAPTTPRTSRHRAPSAPTSTSSTCASTTAGGSTWNGSPPSSATGRPSLISVTQPHNPTGTMFDLATLDALVDLAERSGAVLLVDETYRDLTHGEPLPVGGHPLAERRSACRRCRRPTACPACASDGRSAGTPVWPSGCWRPRSRC